MTKYTKGPWKVEIIKDNSGNWDYQIRTDVPKQTPSYGKHIATCNSVFMAKGENNAQLIAAAPELLEACKEALNQLHGCLRDLTDYFEIKHTKATIETLEEAISKAVGRQ